MVDSSENLRVTLYSFFSDIMPTYLRDFVPVGAPFPYLTYEYVYGANMEDTLLQIKIMDKTKSTKTIVDYTSKLERVIGDGAIVKGNLGGTLWIKKGDPFAQMIQDEDINIRTMYINLIINSYL